MHLLTADNTFKASALERLVCLSFEVVNILKLQSVAFWNDSTVPLDFLKAFWKLGCFARGARVAFVARSSCIAVYASQRPSAQASRRLYTERSVLLSTQAHWLFDFRFRNFFLVGRQSLSQHRLLSAVMVSCHCNSFVNWWGTQSARFARYWKFHQFAIFCLTLLCFLSDGLFEWRVSNVWFLFVWIQREVVHRSTSAVGVALHATS